MKKKKILQFLPAMNDGVSLQKSNDLLENNEWLYDLQCYMGDYGLPYGDLIRIANYGLTNKDGHTKLVILDSGLDEEIFNNYYSRR